MSDPALYDPRARQLVASDSVDGSAAADWVDISTMEGIFEAQASRDRPDYRWRWRDPRASDTEGNPWRDGQAPQLVTKCPRCDWHHDGRPFLGCPSCHWSALPPR